MSEQLQEIKARLEAATPGPWMKDPDEPVRIMKPDKPGSSWDGTVIATLQWDDFGLFEEANADLIAHTPEDLAKLIAALEAVEAWAGSLERDAAVLQLDPEACAAAIRKIVTRALA